MDDRKFDQMFRKQLRTSIAKCQRNNIPEGIFRLYTSQIIAEYLVNKIEHRVESSLSKIFE
jgi:hypothetical protein